RAEQSAERVTLASEEPLSQGLGGEDESVVGCYVALGIGGVHQSAATSVAGSDPMDPSWRPGDP
ncbi:hypothetical protein KI387_020769, partial [Taxus chinensis]